MGVRMLNGKDDGRDIVSIPFNDIWNFQFEYQYLRVTNRQKPCNCNAGFLLCG